MHPYISEGIEGINGDRQNKIKFKNFIGQTRIRSPLLSVFFTSEDCQVIFSFYRTSSSLIVSYLCSHPLFLTSLKLPGIEKNYSCSLTPGHMFFSSVRSKFYSSKVNFLHSLSWAKILSCVLDLNLLKKVLKKFRKFIVCLSPQCLLPEDINFRIIKLQMDKNLQEEWK